MCSDTARQTGEAIDLKNVKVKFTGNKESLLYPVTAEIYVNKLLNRQEFRALCDKHKTYDAIIEQLE